MKIESFSHRVTNIAKFLAILLILNSHLDSYYPIEHIATGGAIGNAFFFALSGYGVAKSFEKVEAGSIWIKSKWLLAKVFKLLLKMSLVGFLFLLPFYIFNDVEITTRLFFRLLLPVKLGFTFLDAVLLFYVVGMGLFLIKKYVPLSYSFIILIFANLFLYFSTVNYSEFTSFTFELNPLFLGSAWFTLFIFGAALTELKLKLNLWRDLFIAIFAVIVIYFHKYLIFLNYTVEYQILQHLMLYPAVMFGLKFIASIEYGRILNLKFISKTIEYISSATLEIYMIHIVIVSYFLDFGFPFNLLIFVTVLSVILVVVKSISDALMKFTH